MKDRFYEPQNALHRASRDGDIGAIKALLADGRFDIEQSMSYYGTPLHVAISYGKLDAVKTLLSAGADLETLAPCEDGDPYYTALALAVKHQNREIANALWEYGAKIDEHTNGNWDRDTLLRAAAVEKRGELVEDVLSWLSDWDQETAEFNLYAAAGRWNGVAVKALLKHFTFTQSQLEQALNLGASPRQLLHTYDLFLDRRAYNPRVFADQRMMIEALLEAGASVNARRRNGSCALHGAAFFLEGNDGLKLLLERGADANIPNTSRGQTALHISAGTVFHRRGGMRRRIHNEEAIQALLQHGASVTASDHMGDMVLNVVAKNGTLPIFGMCLASIGYTLPKNEHGETLLHSAAAGGQFEIVAELIASGEDVNVVSFKGWSALLFALTPNAPTSAVVQVVRLLLLHGAQVDTASDEGWTALHRVAFLGDDKGEAAALAEVLLSLGAEMERTAEVPVPGLDHREWSSLDGHILRYALAEQYDKCADLIFKDLTSITLGC